MVSISKGLDVILFAPVRRKCSIRGGLHCGAGGPGCVACCYWALVQLASCCLEKKPNARLTNWAKALGALRNCFFSSSLVPKRVKGQVYAGGVLAVLLYDCESWCLAAASLSKLCLSHNKRIREMCCVAMCQTMVHRFALGSLQQRTSAFKP
jgi:hypothetical protein